MTLSEAILDLHRQGLPYPSAFSVFFLYRKIGEQYCKPEQFENNFSGLLEMQKTIQNANVYQLNFLK